MASLNMALSLLFVVNFTAYSNAMLFGQKKVKFESADSGPENLEYDGDFSVGGKVAISGNLDNFAREYLAGRNVYAYLNNSTPVQIKLTPKNAEDTFAACPYSIIGEFTLGYNSAAQGQTINFSARCIGTFSHPNRVTIKVIDMSGLQLDTVLNEIITNGFIDVVTKSGNLVRLTGTRKGEPADSFVYSGAGE